MSAHAVTMSPGADPDALAAETADALRPPRESDFDPNPPHVAIFVALVFFLFLEYVRPPVISNLKFQMLFSILIPIFWATNKDRPWSPVIGLQIGMLAHAAISVAYAPNYFTAFMATRTLWANCVASLAIFWVLQRKSYFGPTVWVWALIMAYQAFYAATAGGGQGLGGFIGDENDLAMAAGTAVPFMLMGMQLFTGIRRWVSLVLLVVLIMGIVVSESRGGFLGLAGVVAYCLFYSKNRLRNFLIILVGGVIFALSIPSDYKEELSSISETKSGTAEARFFLWASAVNMWIDNPVLGVGAMNSPWLVGAYQPRGSMGGLFSDRGYQDRDWTMTAMHSIYFEMLSETGLVGVGFFTALVVIHFRSVGRARKRVQRSRVADPELKRDAELYGIALSGAMAGFLICGVFLSIFYYPFFYYFTAMAVAYEIMIDRRLKFANAQARYLHARWAADRDEPGSPSAPAAEVAPSAAPGGEAGVPGARSSSPGAGRRDRPASLGALAAEAPDPRRPRSEKAAPGEAPGLNRLLRD